ncbi:MAG: VOC family protein [Gammaproteobacteria bacterium]|nr:VOC family protein [Gammaproteobacteria bacterium]NIR85793.1 VOC family protein [Gammaproteobacteria bacterium]NIR90547.1 VOC family protein [Gammaproteobacteria bacterium]NIU06928.1 VOC family protein [Gammaproteobacteria bacterium]NIV53858.1 VOC family protein [Gammaproteobacteria bacterium]
MQLGTLDYTVVIVEDLDRSLEFYTQMLGLELAHRSGPFAQMQTGTTRLAFCTREAMAQTLDFRILPPANSAPAFELGFKVDDVDAAYKELTGKGVPSVAAPADRPWGQRTAYVRDPDGYLIELVQDLRRP